MRQALYGECGTGTAPGLVCGAGGIGCDVDHRQRAANQLWQLFQRTVEDAVNAKIDPLDCITALAEIGAAASIADLELRSSSG
jgi:hypothetical protein